MPDELLQTLMRFHREVFLPDFERVLKHELGGVHGEIDRMQSEMRFGFDAIHRRFDRLESKYGAWRKVDDAVENGSAACPSNR